MEKQKGNILTISEKILLDNINYPKDNENIFNLNMNCKSKKKIYDRKINTYILLNINKKISKIYLNLISLLIILLFPIATNEKKIYLRHLYFCTEIRLTIKGYGNQYILNNISKYLYNSVTNRHENFLFNTLPSKILVNGNNIYNIDFVVYDLILDENNITLRFSEPLKNSTVMFYGLSNITKIEFYNFNISSMENMDYMFMNCTSLRSINFNLNEFTKSSITSMSNMFKNCINLKSINFKYFNTSFVTNMTNMFYNCQLLESLDLSSFDTSKLVYMSSMFFNCTSLQTLNLRHFDTYNAVSMNSMFYNCLSLNSLDLSHFDTSEVTDMSSMFYNCTSLEYLNLSHFDTFNVTFMESMFERCSSLKSLDLSHYITSNIKNISSMFEGCSSLISLDLSHFVTSSTTNMGSMFKGCKSLIFLDLNQFSPQSPNYLYEMFSGINENLIYCSNGSNKDYITNSLKSIALNSINNCSDICFDKDINKKIIITENKCDFECISQTYKYKYKNMCYDSCPNNSLCSIKEIKSTNISNWNLEFFFKEQNNAIIKDYLTKDKIINNIRNLISKKNNNLNNLLGENNNNLLVQDNDIIYQITTLDNLNNKENNNIPTMDLEDCGNILKTVYDIKNQSLVVFKVDYFQEGLLIPVIGYEIYHPLNNSLLDLKYCSNVTIDINIPVNISKDEAFKHDPKNEYYTDSCKSYTTENGTDIILNDRYDEYINNNMSLCENNCSFEEYDTDKQMVTCKCEIKPKQIVIADVMNDTNILNNNITNNSSSSVTMKCYYVLFTKEGIVKNVENYILIFIIILFIILGILFYKCGYPLLEDDIKEIIESKEEDKNSNNNLNETIDNKEKSNKLKKKNKNVAKMGIINPIQLDSKDNSKSVSNINLQNNQNLEKILVKDQVYEYKSKKAVLFTDYELNTFLYNDALIFDKRSYFSYYMSLLRTKNPILFAFFPINDYNSNHY